MKNGAVYEGVFKTYGPEVRITHSSMFFIGAAVELDLWFPL